MNIRPSAAIHQNYNKIADVRRKTHIWFLLGIAAMALTVLPNLILGKQSVFTWHDQLDGEMIAYILQARHLFSGDVLPEFMGGMSKTALTLPAPACVLLFVGGGQIIILPPCWRCSWRDDWQDSRGCTCWPRRRQILHG